MDSDHRTLHAAPVTVQVTVTGLEASLLRDLAAVAGRSPESLALDYISGKLVLPDVDLPPIEWGIFDGPTALSIRAATSGPEPGACAPR